MHVYCSEVKEVVGYKPAGRLLLGAAAAPQLQAGAPLAGAASPLLSLVMCKQLVEGHRRSRMESPARRSSALRTSDQPPWATTSRCLAASSRPYMDQGSGAFRCNHLNKASVRIVS